MNANLAEQVARSKASPPRPPVEPGSEAQIDYGRLGSWIDPATDRQRTLWAFVMVLACSRLMFVHPVFRLDQTSWCASHVLHSSTFGLCGSAGAGQSVSLTAKDGTITVLFWTPAGAGGVPDADTSAPSG